MSLYLISFLFVSFVISIGFIHFAMDTEEKKTTNLFLGFSIQDFFLAVIGVLVAAFVFAYMSVFTQGRQPVLHETERWLAGASSAVLIPFFILWVRDAISSLWKYWFKPIINHLLEPSGYDGLE